MKDHLFSKDNQPNKQKKKPRFKDRFFNAVIRVEGFEIEADEGKEEIESKMLEHVARRAFDPSDQSSAQLLNAVINRIYPPIKSVMPEIEFDFDSEKTPVQNINAMMETVASGENAPDVVIALVSAYKLVTDIEESQDLKARIELLEKLHESLS